jgi:two-component system, chemotaxis family, sensor histidine kinase and response regulator WspE
LQLLHSLPFKLLVRLNPDSPNVLGRCETIAYKLLLWSISVALENMPSFSREALMEFIRQEFKGQTTILSEALALMETGDKGEELKEVALKSAQSILGIAKIAHLNPLLSLASAFENYWNFFIETERQIKEEHLTCIFQFIAEISQIAEESNRYIDKHLNEKTAVYNKLANEFENFCKEEAEEKNGSFSLVDHAKNEGKNSLQHSGLVKLFLQEMYVQSQALNGNLSLLEHSSTDKPRQEIQNLIQISQAIKRAAGILNLDLFKQLGDSLEAFFKALIKDERILQAESKNILYAIGKHMSLMAQSTPHQFASAFNDQKESLQELSMKLHLFVPFDVKAADKNVKTDDKPAHPPETGDLKEIQVDPAMFDLFKTEVETQVAALNQGLIDLEKQPNNETLLNSLMRAAHSIKGAARVINLSSIVKLTHAMEDRFTASQQQNMLLDPEKIDLLLQAVDFLSRLSQLSVSNLSVWLNDNEAFIDQLVEQISSGKAAHKEDTVKKKVSADVEISPSEKEAKREAEKESKKGTETGLEGLKKSEKMKAFQTAFMHDRVLRVTAQNLNRLMGLAGESLVESRWLYPFSAELQDLKKAYNKLSEKIDRLKDLLKASSLNEIIQAAFSEVQRDIHNCQHQLSDRLGELDAFIRRHANLSDGLYQEVINSRMRPFADGVEAFPRMVRDLARQLGKNVRLEIQGKSTPVDRDILERLETPLSHLLRNAIDHGIEKPHEREAAGKPVEGFIWLDARHRGGMLAITVSDDGKGINFNELRKKIVERKLVTAEAASQLSESEVSNFLFLPGFSTASSVTEISGRGVGLNIVLTTVQEFGGVVHVTSKFGQGTTFYLRLPLTLSVIRALLVEIAGESYAFPLARIDQVFLIDRAQIAVVEGQQFFHYEGKNIGLIPAWQVLELGEPKITLSTLPIIVLSDRLNSYGLVIDKVIGEKELVVQELDSRLGKIPNIAAGALMENGSPVLIIDVEEIVRSIDNWLSRGEIISLAYESEKKEEKKRKKVLVVDDSITVREVECRLLQNEGYELETAVNGMDGWNAVRIGHYDLVITDIDMPRMNGIELVKSIKNDVRLRSIPVMIVSYKSTEEDRLKGLEAGADYYLTKSSFHDVALLDAVFDLIGQP